MGEVPSTTMGVELEVYTVFFNVKPRQTERRSSDNIFATYRFKSLFFGYFWVPVGGSEKSRNGVLSTHPYNEICGKFVLVEV